MLDDYFIHFTEVYDPAAVVLLDKQEIGYNERTLKDDIVIWYLFKAVGVGTTQVTINFFEHFAVIPASKIYNITIS